MSLSTGLVAQDTVDVDDAQHVGAQILTFMAGHSVADVKFSQKHQIKMLESAVHVKTASGERIYVEP